MRNFMWCYVLSQRDFPKDDFPSDNFPSGNFPNVQFPRRQLPKSKVKPMEASCNGGGALRQGWARGRALRLEKAGGGERSDQENTWEFGKLQIWEVAAKLFGKVLTSFI